MMIEELKSTDIINKVGGRFKLTALIQKRLDELVQGARPLIEDTEGKTILEIVIQEILQDKITAETEDSKSTKPDEEKE
jgi:DNA-directed RNA polymerase subunit omega